MSDVCVVGPGGGEVIDLGPARVRILEDGSATSHRLGFAEITLAPHSPGPPQHRHARHDEGFYVVAGTVTRRRRRRSMGANMKSSPAYRASACWLAAWSGYRSRSPS